MPTTPPKPIWPEQLSWKVTHVFTAFPDSSRSVSWVCVTPVTCPPLSALATPSPFHCLPSVSSLPLALLSPHRPCSHSFLFLSLLCSFASLFAPFLSLLTSFICCLKSFLNPFSSFFQPVGFSLF